MNPTRRMSLLEKLFVWSIVLEPMLFFVLAERTITGVGGNISRLLQLLTLTGLGLRALAFPIAAHLDRLTLRTARRLYGPHITYLAMALVAGLVGWLSGAYAVPATPNVESLSIFSAILNSPAVRPVFEYVIAAYYFLYFVVLPQFMLNTGRKLNYFLSVFVGMYMLSLVVGFVDIAVSAAGFEGLPRHLLEGRTVGVRYHGFAGEPRDAFVFLFFGIAMLHLRAFYRQRRRISRLLVASVIVAMALTQSASGLVGLGIGVGLVVAYSLRAASPRQIGLALGFAAGAVLFGYLSFIASERLQFYAENALGVWTTLEQGGTEFGVFAGQMPSILPLYDLYLKVRAWDLIPIIIGSGFGSASAVNNRYLNVVELANPASQIVRMLYEVGILGTILFIGSFVRPVRYLTRDLSPVRRRQFLMLTLILLGCFLGHRSATAYIYLGMVMCVFRVMARESGRDSAQPRMAQV